MSILRSFLAKRIAANERKPSDYDGKVCLLVNVASACALTLRIDEALEKP